MLTFRASTIDDCKELSTRLREEDIEELKLHNSTPLQSLLKGFIFSNECITILVDGKPEGMFGFRTDEMPMGWGVIWLLGSHQLDKFPREWIKLGRHIISKYLDKCCILYNTIDLRQKAHIKWLKLMGAVFGEPQDKVMEFFILKRRCK